MPPWCEHCDWGVRSGSSTARGVVGRQVDASLRRWAVRLHERLVRDPDSVTPSRRPALVLAVAVLLVAVAVVGLGLWGALLLDGWWRVAALAFWALVVWEFAPRPTRLDTYALVVADDHVPGLRALVDDVARRVGARSPEVLAVETDANAYVVALGYGRRQALVVGLPLWTTLDPDERVALLGHELGHLRSRDTSTGVVLGTADALLARAVRVLHPDGVGDHDDIVVLASEAVGNVLQRMVVWPVALLRLLLVRLSAQQSQHAEYVADRLAARASGPQGLVSLLASFAGEPRGWTAAEVAARTRQDPWVALETGTRPTEREVRRRCRAGELEEHRVDASHPPTHLRLDLARRMTDEGTDRVDTRLVAAADDDLRALRPELTRQLTDDLVHGRY
ncbi:M48 family metallopeptidase [Phycicoccus avicenniae]|uniref:M48 family metallopeptidase n=1 Tax=Phycicoccus avicenniae TaxID=2828860 RepID=UPI003D2DB792